MGFAEVSNGDPHGQKKVLGQKQLSRKQEALIRYGLFVEAR